MKKKLAAKMAWTMLMFLLVCSAALAALDTAEAAASPAKISLSASKKVMYVGDSFRLKVAKVSPKNASASVTYKIGNKNIASVNSKGKVTAKKRGSTVVTVVSKKNKKAKATCKIVVRQQVKKIEVTNAVNKKIAVRKGKKITLKKEVSPSDASSKKLKYTVKNKKIAAVSSNGKITGKAYGKTELIVKAADGKGAKAKITVVVPKVAVKSVKLNAASKTLEKGQAFTLAPKITPSNATVKDVAYKSNNTKVATVSTKGKVKAIAPGTAVISAVTLDGRLKAACKVTVTAAAAKKEPVKAKNFGIYKNDEIPIRDTYVLTYGGKYYLFGTEGETAFSDKNNRFEVYVGDDLKTWEGPYTAFPRGGWDGKHEAISTFWAPEVYEHNGSFYMFASMGYSGGEDVFGDRYAVVLKADNPLGPYQVWNDRLMHTGNDATLYVQENAAGKEEYYLISNYTDPKGEHKTAAWISKLTDDFKHIVGEPMCIFDSNTPGFTVEGSMYEGFDVYQTKTGRTILMIALNGYGLDKSDEEGMIWGGYYVSTLMYFDHGIIDNKTGRPSTDFTFANNIFAPMNCGHNCFFESLEGKLMMGVHFPNQVQGKFGPWELKGDYGYPYFFPVDYDAKNDTLVVDRTEFYEMFGDDYYNLQAEGAPPVWKFDPRPAKKSEEIDIRDAYVLTHDGKYYLYGTEGFNAFSEDIKGFPCYVSEDLKTWEGPYNVFANDGSVWATHRYWAPEVYEINGTFYMFAAWSTQGIEQQLCVLKADNPMGPFEVVNDSLAPGNDPTLYREDGKYYLLYNDTTGHPNMDTTMWALELKDDFTGAVGERIKILDPVKDADCTLVDSGLPEGWETYVTPTGKLIVMYSFRIDGKYCSSLINFPNGIFGGHEYTDQLFTPFNMGHNNFFYDLNGNMMMSTHYPDDNDCDLGCSYPYFFPVNYDAEKDTLVLDTKEFFDRYGEEYNKKFGSAANEK